MPLYEYQCSKCSHTFEFLTKAGENPVCPKCNAKKVEKLLSSFAVGGTQKSSASSLPIAPCGSCGDPRGPGSCRFKQ